MNEQSLSFVDLKSRAALIIDVNREMAWIEERRAGYLADEVKKFVERENERRRYKANSLFGRLLGRKFVEITQAEIDTYLDTQKWGSFYTPRQDANHWYSNAYNRLKNIRMACLDENVVALHLSLEDYRTIKGQW